MCCIALRFRSRAIAAMSSPCAATSAPTTLCDEGVSRRAQRRTKCKPQAAVEPHQLLRGEPPRRSVPLGQRLAEADAHRVFVRHGLVGQLRPVRLLRRRAHDRVDAPEASVRVVCQPQRAVIATQRVALRPCRPARGGETCGEGAGKPPHQPRPRQPRRASRSTSTTQEHAGRRTSAWCQAEPRLLAAFAFFAGQLGPWCGRSCGAPWPCG